MIEAPQGKLIIGILFSSSEEKEEVLPHLQITFAASIQRYSPVFPFTQTDYYTPEMGDSLYRQFMSLTGAVSLEEAVSWKKKTIQLENQRRTDGRRQVNLDPGYVDLHKVVLLSQKQGAQKIYLQQGVWADPVLLKNKGGYEKLRGTFPDLKTGQYDPFFLGVRRDLKMEFQSLTDLPE